MTDPQADPQDVEPVAPDEDESVPDSPKNEVPEG